MCALLIALLLSGCTVNNPAVQVETDMVGENPADMLEPVLDGLQANQPDMLEIISPDLLPANPADMLRVSDLLPTADLLPCTDMVPQTYAHHDTFCADSWTDSSTSVDPALPGTAQAACESCCKTTTGVACGCTVSYIIDPSNNYTYFYNFIINSGGIIRYRFFYIDNTSTGLAGKADRYYTTGSQGLNWWKQ